MLATGRARVEAAGLAERITLEHGRAESLPFGDAAFGPPHVHVPHALRRRRGGNAPGSSRGSSARAGRSPRSSSACRRFRRRAPPGRPTSGSDFHSPAGSSPPAGARSATSSARASAASTGGCRSSGSSSSGGARGSRTPAAPAQLRRRRRDLRPAPLRPAFYALAPGGWRDYVTLVHPPYTLWHLSYVPLGACLAPEVHADRLLWTIAAFALAMGVAAHALDELNGRPLGTAIPTRVLWALAAVSLAGAVAIGIGAAVTWTGLAGALRHRRRLLRRGLQPRAPRGPVPRRRVVRVRLGRVPGPHRLLRAGREDLRGRPSRRRRRRSSSLAQRRLSTEVRTLRRRVSRVEGTVTFGDGASEALTTAALVRAPEGRSACSPPPSSPWPPRSWSSVSAEHRLYDWRVDLETGTALVFAAGEARSPSGCSSGRSSDGRAGAGSGRPARRRAGGRRLGGVRVRAGRGPGDRRGRAHRLCRRRCGVPAGAARSGARPPRRAGSPTPNGSSTRSWSASWRAAPRSSSGSSRARADSSRSSPRRNAALRGAAPRVRRARGEAADGLAAGLAAIQQRVERRIADWAEDLDRAQGTLTSQLSRRASASSS